MPMARHDDELFDTLHVEVIRSRPNKLATTNPTDNMHDMRRYLPHQRRFRGQRMGSRGVRNAVHWSDGS